jgi:CIC family chloride channel protein
VVTAGICIGSGGSVGREGPIVQIGSALASQALRQLEVYGRDGLPVVSADGRRVEGWITSATVLRGLARQITGTRTAAAEAQAAAGDCREDAEAMLQHQPTALAGYQVAEITVTAGSPAAGRKLQEVAWPQAGIPVSLLRGRRLGPPDPGITLAEGDRVGLLIPTPPGPQHRP